MSTTTNDDGAGEACPVEAILPSWPPCTNDILRRATRHLGQLYDEAFAPTGLKSTQLVLMFQIARLTGDEGPTLQTVAAHVGVGVSALTYALRPLQRDGLVDLVPDLKDKRAKHAVLTALGRERLDEGIKLWSEANRRVETLLGPDDAKLLRNLAERVSSDAFSSAFKAGLR
jgi:DNA-binding MarR family transcriptional regulator